MKRLLVALAALLVSVIPVRAGGGLAATITAEVVGSEVVYHVTVENARNPYVLWVGQNCYLDGVNVDLSYAGVVWETVTPTKGKRYDGTGSATLPTSGIHNGGVSNGVPQPDVPWTSDHCEAWLWLWPDLDPIAIVPLFPT